MKTGGCSQSEHRSHSSMPAPVSYLYSPAISFCCGNHNSAVSTRKKKGRRISSRESVPFILTTVFSSVWIAQFTKTTAFVLCIQTPSSGFICAHNDRTCTTQTLHSGHMWFGPVRKFCCQEGKVHRMYCHFSSSSHPPSAPTFPYLTYCDRNKQPYKAVIRALWTWHQLKREGHW